MFKLVRLLLFVGIGFYLGLKFNDTNMQAQCSKVGDWQSGLCLVTEIPK